MELNIFKAINPEDLTRIETLAKVIWKEHYTPIIGIEQVSYMLDKFQSTKAMLQHLEEGYEYYGLEHEGVLQGYFCFKPEAQDLFISKFYVSSEVRGKGVGRKLLKFIEDKAKELKKEALRLTVNKYNPSVEVYLRMGFVKVRPVVFDIGQGYIMDDFEMKKFIKPINN